MKYLETEAMKNKTSMFSINGEGFLRLEYNNLKNTQYDAIKDTTEFMKINKINDPNKILIFNYSSLILPLYTKYSFLISRNKTGINEIDPAADIADTLINLLKFILNHPSFDIDRKIEASFGNTLLMFNVANGISIGSEILIEDFNASPFIRDLNAKHTLHLIIMKGRKSVSDQYENQLLLFEKILRHKEIHLHVNDQDEDGNTALHIAIARRDLDYIIPLIRSGASLEIRNQENLTPIDVAQRDKETRAKIIVGKRSFSNKKFNEEEFAQDVSNTTSFDKETFNQNPENILSIIKDAIKSTEPRTKIEIQNNVNSAHFR